MKLFDANRWAYNRVVAAYGDRIYTKEGTMKSALTNEIRCFVKKGGTNADILREYNYDNIPEEVFDSAFRDVLKARRSALANAKNNKLKLSNKLAFRRKNACSASIEIRARSLNTKTPCTVQFWKKYFECSPLVKTKEPLPDEIAYSCRLQRERTGRYYLCIPYHREIDDSVMTGKMAALDPGVRTFQTLYEPDCTIEFGTNPDVLETRLNIVQKLRERLSTSLGRKFRRTRQRLRREILNIHAKVKRMIKDCHHSVSAFLSQTYDTIFIPEFQSKRMVQKKNVQKRSVLARKTCRAMMTWSHYSFRTLLRQKMQLRGKQCPLELTEEYTSKTCTRCGRINHALGGNKVFKCPSPTCAYTIDRDVNGARNILMKSLATFECVL